LAHQGHSIDKTPSTQHVEQVQMDTIVTIGYKNQSGIRHASPTTPPFNPSPDRGQQQGFRRRLRQRCLRSRHKVGPERGQSAAHAEPDGLINGR
jgi:hypothetical protein